MLSYYEYINESQIYQLLLESKLIYSKKFINILHKMRDDKVANILIKLYTKDVDKLQHNYIDITDDKDKVSFTPDRKVQELSKDKKQTWKVIDDGRYLTHSDRNDSIFKELGYDKNSQSQWAPDEEQIGIILAETISKTSGNVYVLFQEYGTDTPRLSVLNKVAVEESDVDDFKIWSTSRNPVNVGRLARAILKSADIDFMDKDIEKFVNTYKATYDFTKDALNQFDIVSGDKIAHWYYCDQYVDGGGSLNNSCMAEVNSEYFDIYCNNRQISLVILYSEDGKIEDGKYVSNKIKGRALLWDCQIGGVSSKFMDRIYTAQDSDVELFKQFAESKGFWYKKSQTMDPNEYITDGANSKSIRIVADLDDTDFEYYPYMDTLCFINKDDNWASNEEEDAHISCRSTEGEYGDL